MPLNDVTICITSFLRPGYLKKTCEGIKANLPECYVFVVDDSGDSTWAIAAQMGFTTSHLEFDSGLPAKRNESVRFCESKYWLCGCDDFDFSTPEARSGIEKMVKVLDEHPDIDVASGRVDNNPYEGFLEYVPGEFVKEHRLKNADNPQMVYAKVDLTVNYFIARTDRIVFWDERMKIGGEHFDWFMQMKQAGRKVAFVPGVNITTFHVDGGADPRYGQYRGRAVGLGHKIMMEKWNIKEYRGF